MVENSILTTVKKMLGITEEYEEFDLDIIIHINSVFGILNQIGLGPDTQLIISDKSTTWDAFTENKEMLEMAKSYMYLKVRMLFDPPTTSGVSEAVTKSLEELEWRMHIWRDNQMS